MGSVTSGRVVLVFLAFSSLRFASSRSVCRLAIFFSSSGICLSSSVMASRSWVVTSAFWLFSWALPASSWAWAASSSFMPSLIFFLLASSSFLASARRSLTLTSSLSLTASIFSWSSVICTDFSTRPVVDTLATPSTRSSWGSTFSLT